MNVTTETFDHLDELILRQAGDQALEDLARQLTAAGQFHELFEVRKFQVRRRLGLPILYRDQGDELAEPTQRALEDGLFEACREVGTGLLENARIREGWMYLRPLGDRALAARLLAKIEPTDENVDELIEVLLNEGVDPGRGYQLVLDQYGTCNAITLFESMVTQQPTAAQQAAARALLRHLHAELLESVRAHVAQQAGDDSDAAMESDRLGDLVADRDWLFAEHSYHIDTTHLASTVRFARILDDPEDLALALDLTEYGRRLSDQFQYQGDPPFEQIYTTHGEFFRALLGENVTEAIDHFRQRIDAYDLQIVGTGPIEILVDLLARLGRPAAALQTALQRLPAQKIEPQWLQVLLDLAQQAGQYEDLLAYCREHQDPVGYAAVALAKADCAKQV